VGDDFPEGTFQHEELLGSCQGVKLILWVDIRSADPLAYWHAMAYPVGAEHRQLVLTSVSSGETLTDALLLPGILSALLTRLEGYLTPVV
jgi:hypothetical protein